MKMQLLSLCLLFAAYGSPAQNNYIIFRPDSHCDANTVRIYIDRYGNVYPDAAAAHVCRSGFPDTGRKNRTYADLRSYFLLYDTGAAQRAFGYYGVADFDQFQDRLISSCADSITQKLNGRKLVVLIHGFNDYARAGYDSLKRHILSSLEQQHPLFLEVFWDGLKASSETFGDVSKIWFRANKTAPYAAYTLRKLFLQIPDTRIYIIGHSLGACVAARLLFNAADRRNFPLKKEWKSLATPPQKHITLALLAPAIPGKRIFRNMNHTVPAGNCGNYKRLVVGYNRYDYATTKRCRFPLAYTAYATSLGCDRSVVNGAGRMARKRCPGLALRTTDLSGCENSCNTHHMEEYAGCARISDFMNAVFAD